MIFKNPYQQLIVGQARDVGQKRKGKPNQDSVAVLLPGMFNPRPPLLAVADGMGGYRGGELAGQLVTRSLVRIHRQSKGTDYRQVLEEGIRAAHAAMQAEARRNPENEKMGSALAAGIWNGGVFQLANVGDCRVYRINEAGIQQISSDQSLVAEQVRLGLITPEEALSHPKRNVLSMSVSAQRVEISPYFAVEEVGPQDILLLCSDGLWGSVPERVLYETAINLHPQTACRELVRQANLNGGPDNISVVIARWGAKVVK